MGGSIRKQRLQDDDRAEITGLPLYLMIIVVVAGVGLALVLGFTDILAEPPSQFGDIEFMQPDGTAAANPYQLVCANSPSYDQVCEGPLAISVIVRDSDGAKLDGAAVEASGAGINTGGVTSNGEFPLSGDVTIAANKASNSITFVVSKADFPDARQELVITRG